MLTPSAVRSSARTVRAGRIALQEEEGAEAPPAPPTAKAKAAAYDLGQVNNKQGAGGGAGFNVGLVDPIAAATGFVSRRFGLAGGLAVVALLAATEGREIVVALLDKGPEQVPRTPDLITSLFFTIIQRCRDSRVNPAFVTTLQNC